MQEILPDVIGCNDAKKILLSVHFIKRRAESTPGHIIYNSAHSLSWALSTTLINYKKESNDSMWAGWILDGLF